MRRASVEQIANPKAARALSELLMSCLVCDEPDLRESVPTILKTPNLTCGVLVPASYSFARGMRPRIASKRRCNFFLSSVMFLNSGTL